MVADDANVVVPLGLLALELDAKTKPLLPALRRLNGVVVATSTTPAEDFFPGDVI